MAAIRSLAIATLAGFALAPPPVAAECLLVAEAASGRVIHERGACDRLESPASTFKIPLALMGYDAAILTGPHEPAWPYDSTWGYWDEAGRKTIDPTSWLSISVVWYSEILVQKLGPDRFRSYLDRIGYGNRDLSGTATAPGIRGLPPAVWVSSSLRISPRGQLAFLRRMLSRDLGFSDRASAQAEAVVPSFPVAGGLVAHGKTGTGSLRLATGELDPERQFGWFIGWIAKGGERYVFVKLIEDRRPTGGRAGFRARDALLAELPAILARMGG